jgi:type I restriction enzyme, S subunit
MESFKRAPSVVNGVPCIRVVDISNGKIQTDNLITTSEKISASYRRTILKKDDVVIPLRGKVGEIAIVDKYTQGANLTRGVALIALKKEYDSRYVRQYLSCKDSADRFLASMNGSALQEITIATLRRFPLALPSSLKEQIAIGNVLSDTDALITVLEQLITKKKAIKTAAMQQLLTGRTRLTQFAKRPDGTTKNYKSSELGKTPEDWAISTIGDIADVKTGPFGSALHEKDYVQDGTPIITVEHLGELGVTYNNLPMVGDKDKARLRSYQLNIGDIVFSRVGSIDRNALIKSAESGWLFSGRLLRIRLLGRNNHAPYISYHFHTEPFKKRVVEVAVGQTMPSLNTKILKNILILLPKSIEEQKDIATILSDIDAELKALEQKLAKVRDIKQGMMQQLLTGRIRLPLDQQP